MSYALRRDESLGEGLQRICLKQIRDAIALAKNADEEENPVHQIRRCIKKTRAALRLAKKEIGRAAFREQDHRLRDVGRLLSEIRDAEVRLKTARELRAMKTRGRAQSAEFEKLLTLELQNFLLAFAEWQTAAVAKLEAARVTVEKGLAPGLTRKQVRQALQASYKNGRKKLQATQAKPTVENYHALRSATKMLWYQTRILCPAQPLVLKNLGEELDSLGKILGRAHDLSFLGERLQTESKAAAEESKQGQLFEVINDGRCDLQCSAMDLAERFYQERPRDFGARATAWLLGWEKGKQTSVAEALVV